MVLLKNGWRLFFYANEGNEPIHIHCKRGSMECKFWIDTENVSLTEAYAFGLSPRDMREVKNSFLKILITLNSNGSSSRSENEQGA